MALLGAISLIGWILEVPLLTRGSHSLPDMKLNTALAFLIAGFATARWRRPTSPPVGVRACALVVLGLGASSLWQWLTGHDLGIDELLMDDDAARAGPGRMAPTSAFGFLLLGAALLLRGSRRPELRRLARWLIATAGLLAFVSLVGYLYGVGPTFGVVRLTTQMALNSALGFSMLALGLLAGMPHEGLLGMATSDSGAGTLVRRLMPAAFGLPVAIGWLSVVGEKQEQLAAELVLALCATANMLMFTGVVVWSGKAVARQDDLVRRAREQLESRVRERTAELRVTNERLSEASALSRAVLDSAALSVVATSADGVIREFNATAESWLGYRPEEIIGRASPVLFHEPAELEARAQRVGSAIGRAVEPGFEALVAGARQGRVDESEWMYRRKDGSRFPVSLTVTSIRGPDGQLTGFLTVARDLSLRKRAERELHELREALENAVEGIAFVDEAGLYAAVNAAYATAAGWGPHELQGEPWLCTVHPDDRERVDELRERAVKAGKAEADVLGLRRDGEPFHRRIVLIPALRDGGGVRGFYCFSKDITPQKQIEHELVRAKEAAEAAMRARSQFLARMSHEIRTPINGVLGMTRVVLDSQLGDQQREWLEVARTSAESLLAIVDDLLDFSKIDAGKLRLEEQTFDLRDCLTSTVRALAHRAHAKGLELVLAIEPTVPAWVRGDPGRLSQVLGNLVSNAIKFTHEGEVEVSVRRLPGEGPRDSVAFSVRDTGIGIPVEKHTHIFDAFTQGDEGTTRRFGGTGLGLAISSELVGLMGGSITLESSPGRGSTFGFTLPLERSAEPAGTQPVQPTLTGLRVLVVDDHGQSRRVVADLLAAWRMRATAVDTAEALAVARTAEAERAAFRLLIVDELSAARRGPGFLSELRGARAQKPHVVLLGRAAEPTGGSGDSLAAPARDIAARVLKPVSASVLLEAIEALFGESPPVSSGVAAPGAPRPTRRVLVAEDNAINRKVAVTLLTRAGHDVLAVEGGRQAIEALARRRFDVVLMDVQMPDMDGLEATRAIRAGERGSGERTPIVALTAQAMPGDRARCLEAGMDGYLSKPFDPDGLLEEIERVIKALRPSRSRPPPERESPAPAPAAEEPFDAAAALRAMSGDAALFAEIVQLYDEQRDGMLDALVQAASSGDAPMVARAAHKLKGALLNLAAGPASRLALAIEQQGRRGALPSGQQLTQLRRELRRLSSALAASITEATSS